VLSGSARGAVEPVLRRHGLSDCLDLLVAAEDVLRPKPDPQGALQALARLGAAPRRTLMVGDSPIDVRTGRGAGVGTALYHPPANRRFYEPARLAACQAEWRIVDLRQLLEVAQRWAEAAEIP